MFIIIVNRSSKQITNADIVPYNPALLLKYKSHLNVEICSTVSAVKYLFKYCYKGSDRAVMTVEGDEKSQDRDEIKNYLDSRYISATEAIWRLFEFDLHGRYPNVVRLPVHIEGHQTVAYSVDQAREALNRTRNTPLTQYFKCVSAERAHPLPDYILDGNPSAFELLYYEFPKYYSWEKNNWHRRKRPKKSDAVGRMYTAHPSDTERFCLRLLLTTIRGPENYLQLRTFEGIVYPTYKDACFARGLLQSDEQYRRTMNEAVSFASASQLRELFATLLLFCMPVNCLDIYNEFKNDLCEDYAHTIRNNSLNENAEDFALLDIQAQLEFAGKSLHHFNLPLPNERFLQFSSGVQALSVISRNCNEIISESDNNILCEDIITSEIQCLNEDQIKVFNEVNDMLISNRCGLIFVDAPGGTGKTYTFNSILKWVEFYYGVHSAIAMASSGVSALLLRNGKTAHSTFKLPLTSQPTVSCQVDGRSKIADTLRNVKVVVWDEVRQKCYLIHNLIISHVGTYDASLLS
jgi:hypothetical protein